MSRDVAATKHLVLVGTGLGGLSAALALRAMGFRVTVLERGASSGGRIRSVPTEGFSIEANGRQWPKLQDLGAQFLHDRYTTRLPVLSSADPSLVPLRLSTRSVTLREGRAITIDRGHPASIYDRGLLDLLDSARGKYAYDDVIDAIGGIALDDYSQWARFDNGLASSWLESHYGAMGTRYLGEPAIESYFFHRADETSKAAGATRRYGERLRSDDRGELSLRTRARPASSARAGGRRQRSASRAPWRHCRGDDEIFDTVRRELESYFPGILLSEKSRTLMRWPNAIPILKPGRAQELAALWRAQEADAHRILLAGDQTTFATMDGAAHSGMRAAELLAAKVALVNP